MTKKTEFGLQDTFVISHSEQGIDCSFMFFYIDLVEFGLCIATTACFFSIYCILVALCNYFDRFQELSMDVSFLYL
jgi:hypothetical protein